ncbi:MAG: 3-carboxy-cis,cis-muconate cycloisomerase [Pseudomonadota bacterium]
MTSSLFDHPHFKSLLGHDNVAGLFTPEAEIDAMLRFEEALALAERDAGVIPPDAAAAISEAILAFTPNHDALAAGVARDGLVVPSLIKTLRESLDEVYRSHLHFGATSQDVIDTGLMLRLRTAISVLRDDMIVLTATLDRLTDEQGDQTLMARTRMQRALPIRLADRFAIWRRPLFDLVEGRGRLDQDMFAVQFGGPVGTLHQLGQLGPHVRKLLAERLDLVDPGCCWHTERGRIADLAAWLSKVSSSLGKIGQDVALMAQNEIGDVVISNGGRSSAMPHKNNPIRAELLVTLARYNAALLGAIHQASLHESERSGSAWGLEWLTLPPMIAASAAGLSNADAMLAELQFHPS